MSTNLSVEMPKKRTDVTVKIGADVYRKAKLVCAHRDEALSEYLTRILEKPVNKDHAAVLRDLNSRSGNGDDSAE